MEVPADVEAPADMEAAFNAVQVCTITAQQHVRMPMQ